MAFFISIFEDPTKYKNITKRLLKIQPLDIKILNEFGKQSACVIKLFNVSDRNHVAFKINIEESPERQYCLQPSEGLIKPKSACYLSVKNQALSLETADIKCKHKILIQSRIVPSSTNQDDVTPIMFADNSFISIQENMLWLFMFSPRHSSELNFNKNLELVKAMVTDIKEEFGSFKPSDEEEYMIIQKPAKTPEEMSFCEYTRTYTWLFWLAISITLVTVILLITFIR
ncbi:hypothetical protein DCAR_0101714 [Daucus carota subsp. sativus]|uniref:MSP domain-containing protein n=1 Tax=Daucus carota subsp. sativus TaxID=79200 RepID=A0AAF0W3S2_DAUCS|nr:PREDICTED: vesicle-associated protein 2-2-like [Daucus carota subsp. sativus]WOG82549.1 hypothetical protein DCAR_0101714 [Daucus carota subsp. sativus]